VVISTLLIIFPLAYIASFLYAAKGILQGKPESVWVFIVVGLPIYTTSLSISYIQGYEILIPFLQSFKEINILLALGTLIFQLKSPPRLQKIDTLVLAFLLLSIIYAIVPIGEYSITQRLIALKSIAFFPLIYFTGRFLPLESLQVNKILSLICLLTLASAGIYMAENITNMHFQSITGYADFNEAWFNQEESGNYGLSWTFEIENGKKRFASLFSNPLEHAAATILALSVIAALFTADNNKIQFRKLGWWALFASLACIFLSLSRAAFLSYFGVIFLYSLITKRKEVLALFYTAIGVIFIYLLFFVEKDIQEFVMNTIQFTNESSIGHLVEWLEGLEAMVSNPFGLGLGSSGRISALEGTNVGGENQFIIIGVQTGFIGMFLYLAIYISTVVQAIQWFPKLKGKEQKIALVVILAKLGLFIPLFTTNLEAYIYVSYLLWIFNGLFVQVLEKHTNLAA
jgi:hypothetical protein